MRKTVLFLLMFPSVIYAGDLVVLKCNVTQLSDKTAVQFVFTLNTVEKTIEDNHGINYGVYNWTEDAVSFGLKDSTDEEGKPLIWEPDKINTDIEISRVSGDMVIVNGTETTHQGACVAREKLF